MDKTKTIAALFDFDGVVMDTESQYTIYWNEVGRIYHPEMENFGLLIKGQTLVQIYDRYFKGMDAAQAEITAGLNKFESEMKYEYVPGVADFMKELRNNGVKIAIVTSSNEKKMANVTEFLRQRCSPARNRHRTVSCLVRRSLKQFLPTVWFSKIRFMACRQEHRHKWQLWD